MTLSLCCSQGKLDEALEFFEKALAIFMKVNGDSSVEVATTLDNMAGVYQDQASSCETPHGASWVSQIRGQSQIREQPSSTLSFFQVRPGVLELLAAYLSFWQRI